MNFTSSLKKDYYQSGLVLELVVSLNVEDGYVCRQLEAIIRISESLAKMRLAPFATEADVDEALRLFQVSTLDAAMSGSLSGSAPFLLIIFTLTIINYLHINYY